MSRILIVFGLLAIVAIAVQAIESEHKSGYGGYGGRGRYGGRGGRGGYGKYSKSSSSEEESYKLVCTTNAKFDVKVDGDNTSVDCSKNQVECGTCCLGWGISKGWEMYTFFGTKVGDKCHCCRQKKTLNF